MNATPPKIRIRDLSKAFGPKVVLDGLDLDVGVAESVVVIGGSGTGKSVLIKSILGLLRPDQGSIQVDGEEVTGMKAGAREVVNRKFGMLFQGAALFDSLPSWENVSFGLLAQKRVRRAEARDIAVAKLAQVGLEPEVADLYPAELSGGMQKRVALARALVIQPDVLLMDEPLSNLDAKLRVEMRFAIKEIQNRVGITTVYVTHDQEEAMAISDRIAVMKGGVIQQFDAPQVIYNRPVNRFVGGFLGSPGMNFLEGRLEQAATGWRFAAEGVSIPLSTYDFETAPRPGPAAFGVRPEHVGLDSGAGWPFSASATVEVVEPMGSDTLVWLKLAGQNFSVRVTSERAPRAGEMVTVGLDPLRASLFDDVGNRL